MKAFSLCLKAAALVLCLAVRAQSAPSAPSDLDQRLRAFATEKEKQARSLAAEHKVQVAPEIWEFFKTAKAGDWKGVTNQFEELGRRGFAVGMPAADPTVRSPVWSTALEVNLGAGLLLELQPRFAALLVHDLTSGIPTNGVLFGGTDTGRGLPTAFCTSHVRGEHFFTLTQNQFADMDYLHYLRSTYGKSLKMLTAEDSQAAFTTYVEDARRRVDHDQNFPNEPKQIRPGEDVRMDPASGQISVSGQVAVMAINGLLAKAIFERNPKREFFVEESFPLDWMYPHLTPLGAILKLNREPVAAFTDETITADRAFWSVRVKGLLGSDFAPPATVRDVCELVERVHLRRDHAGFKGDPQFLSNREAQVAYSKLRSAGAGLYFWRINETGRRKEHKTQQRMIAESDNAFLQAFALCPYSPEAVFRYSNLLISLGRLDDALLLAGTAAKLDTGNKSFHTLKQQVEQINAAMPAKKP